MKLLIEFMLTEESKMVLPVTTKLGHTYALIIHGQALYMFPGSPISMIDFNLRHNYSSLRGAKDSAAHLLGSTNMHPIVMCAVQRHIWFSSESLKNRTCVWTALHHVRGLIPYNDDKTTIHLTGGWAVTIPVRHNLLGNRLNQAHLLRSLTMQSPFEYSEVQKNEQLMMVYDGHRIDYELNYQKYQLNEFKDEHFSIHKVNENE